MAERPVPSKRFYLIPWLFLGLGLLITYIAQSGPRESSRQALQNEFDYRTNKVVESIHNRLLGYEQILEGTSGLFAGSSSVSREEFFQYVRSLKLEGKYPGIQGLGFSVMIPPHELERHVAAVRASGMADYAVRPDGQRDVYSSIVYLEPSNWRNQRAIGYDMYAEPVRQKAMASARDDGVTRISGKVRLVQETEENVQSGFLMYLPVYEPDQPHQTPEERRASIVGWVYAPFRMNDFMDGLLGPGMGETGSVLHVAVHDGFPVSRSSLMFDSNRSQDDSAALFRSVRRLPLFGHEWTVVITSLPAFDARLRGEKANIISVAGVTGSVLMALIAWLLVSGRSRAMAIAEGMTEELRHSEASLRKRNRDLRLLSDCNAALVHAEDENRLLAEVCRLCVEVGGYRMAWVGYAEHDEARTVRPVAQSGHEEGYLDGISISWSDTESGRGPTGTAIRTGRPCIVQNIESSESMAPWRDAVMRRGCKASVALPLVCDATILGALNIYSADADAFDLDELRLLEELAGDLAYGIVTLRTRTAHAEAKEKLEFLSYFDPLTQLPNRILLRDRFEHAALIARNERTTIAMLYVDLDHFKQVNEGFGYTAGDQVLVTVVNRLRHCVPMTATISRLSADEFVVLLTDNLGASEIAGIADIIRDALAEPVRLNSSVLNLSCSIGIGLFPNDGDDFDSLLKNAHAAVESAKEAGRNSYRFFTREMNAGLAEQFRLTGKFSSALRDNEFLLHYQPQIDIRSGRIIGAEALLRWRDVSGELIPPGSFIPLAERSGHIIPIGEWVLNEACRQAALWQQLYPHAPVVAVNLSALQFKRGNVLELVSKALAASGLRPDRLELELTESILLQDVDETINTLKGLKALGVKLSIDDFGTGYSSLSYLKHLDVDKLKIDQTFVRDMLIDEDGASIVRAVIQLGHALQLTVIAEGVETEDQRSFLEESGCDEAQGYWFSRPLPVDQFAVLLAEACASPAPDCSKQA